MKGLISHNIIAVILCIASVFQVACTNSTDPGDSDNENDQNHEGIIYHERAKFVFERVNNFYFLEEYHLYRENFPQQTGDPEVSYLWPYFGLLGGVNTLIKLGYESDDLQDVITHLEYYADEADGELVYSAYPPFLGESDHYYDDNAVVGIKLLDLYRITGDQKYLKRAEELMPFMYSGETSVCGGGIVWMDQFVDNPGAPNAHIGMSSSGYTVLFSLMLYQLTENEEYLEFATRIYEWLRNRLKDSVQNIYWNDVRMSDCSVNQDLFTYNTGVMMRVEIALYEISGEESHLREARDLARGAFQTFAQSVDGKIFISPERDPWFNVKLLDGYLDLYKYDEEASDYIDYFIENANHAWEHARNEYGLFYEDWTGNTPGRQEWLLNQASLIEVFGQIAMYKGEEVH